MSRKHGGRTSRQRQRDQEAQARMLAEAERVARKTGKTKGEGTGADFLAANKRSERPARISLRPEIPRLDQ